MTNRRQVMEAMLAMAATGAPGMAACAGEAAAREGWFARRHLPIGLQLYTVAEAAQKDLESTFAKVAQIGYRTIELAGYHGHTVQVLRDAANRHGLKFTSIHVGATASGGNPGLDQDMGRLAADLHVLGVTDAVVPMVPLPAGLPARRQNETGAAYFGRVNAAMRREDWLRTATLLNERGGRLRREGIRLGYHNHNLEFAPLGDTNGLEILIANTAPEEVTFELDVGWVAAAGLDPVALLLQHGRRFQLMHVKDIRASTQPNHVMQQDPAEVGAGHLDWRKLLPVAFATGVRKFYVEQEPPFSIDRFEAIARSHAFLKGFDT